MSKKFYAFTIVLALSLSFSGCFKTPTNYFYSDGKGSFIESNATNSIIDDFVTFIKPYYPPAKTVFLINQNPDSEKNQFFNTFQSDLRLEGYGVTVDKNNTSAIPLAYKFLATGKQVIIQYNIGANNLIRAYEYDKYSQTYKSITPFTSQGVWIKAY